MYYNVSKSAKKKFSVEIAETCLLAPDLYPFKCCAREGAYAGYV
jgi:hypothetical protein